MPTNNPRINMTLPPEYATIIAELAKRDSMSVSAKAKEMVLKGLEMDEDIYFSKLAEEREQDHVKWISHEEAWKDLDE